MGPHIYPFWLYTYWVFVTEISVNLLVSCSLNFVTIGTHMHLHTHRERETHLWTMRTWSVRRFKNVNHKFYFIFFVTSCHWYCVWLRIVIALHSINICDSELQTGWIKTVVHFLRAVFMQLIQICVYGKVLEVYLNEQLFNALQVKEYLLYS